MFKNCLATLSTLIVTLALASPLAAQSSDRAMPMRTPDGQPHISGIFTFRTITPFQRPSQFAGRENLSVSNSLSGRHWPLNQIPAVGNPTHVVKLSPVHRVSAGDA